MFCFSRKGSFSWLKMVLSLLLLLVLLPTLTVTLFLLNISHTRPVPKFILLKCRPGGIQAQFAVKIVLEPTKFFSSLLHQISRSPKTKRHKQLQWLQWTLFRYTDNVFLLNKLVASFLRHLYELESQCCCAKMRRNRCGHTSLLEKWNRKRTFRWVVCFLYPLPSLISCHFLTCPVL